MTFPYKILASLLLIAGIFLGGFYTGRGQKQVEIQEKVITKEGETKVVIRDHTVTVIKTVKPDGTVTEETKTEDKDQNQETKTVSNEKDKSTVTKPILSQYSLGLKYWANLDDKINVSKPDNYEVVVGYRILGDSWLQVGYKLDKQASLGIAVQF